MDDAALRGDGETSPPSRRRAATYAPSSATVAGDRANPPARVRCCPPFHTPTDARVTSATASARVVLQRHRGLTRARAGLASTRGHPTANIRGDLAHPARAERVWGRPKKRCL